MTAVARYPARRISVQLGPARLTQAAQRHQLDAFGGKSMKFRLALGAAALLCVGIAGSAPANAVTYLYEINAFCSQCGQPSGATNSITGSFTMDNIAGPASISNIDIHATLPTGGGTFFNFSFDQVINPVSTWNAFGGSSPYLSFANSAFSAGDTHFWMGVKYDMNSNDGSYLIGLWGNSGNPHQSEISVINFNNWQGITGRMTQEIAPVPLGPSTWPMMILGFAGVAFMAYRRKSRRASMAASLRFADDTIEFTGSNRAIRRTGPRRPASASRTCRCRGFPTSRS